MNVCAVTRWAALSSWFFFCVHSTRHKHIYLHFRVYPKWWDFWEILTIFHGTGVFFSSLSIWPWRLCKLITLLDTHILNVWNSTTLQWRKYSFSVNDFTTGREKWNWKESPEADTDLGLKKSWRNSSPLDTQLVHLAWETGSTPLSVSTLEQNKQYKTHWPFLFISLGWVK